MSDILNKIVHRKREEVAERKKKMSETQLESTPHFHKPRFSLSRFLVERSGIIAEFKRKSPSKPMINLQAISSEIVPKYEKAGASASSILTDIDFFGGSDEDLINVRPLVNIPILRKDFMIDPYQIIESKALGADVILLIAEILSKSEVEEMAKLATELGMEVLLEVHTADQLKKYHESIRNVGVNNRNLKTFVTDIRFSIDILPQIPNGVMKVSESGIDNTQTVIDLKKAGYEGFLIGENFMKTSDPGASCTEFINAINQVNV
ncbi:MAG: indole-3-glycerol phosphate synthase TrpC [Saprospiraceae bacterium]|jgi:indole-3-glycerol phosphate synthase|nr:indole-3-glycerol phosphate synthase TrpC [Saprospiraceae bacterium]